MQTNQAEKIKTNTNYRISKQPKLCNDFLKYCQFMELLFDKNILFELNTSKYNLKLNS